MEYYIVDPKDRPVSCFQFGENRIVFRKKDCLVFSLKNEAEQLLSHIVRLAINKAQALSLRIVEGVDNIDW